jgi:hypothetical protein
MHRSWSEYGNGDNYQGDGDGQANGCGGDGGDEYWYMGRTQCFRANVAFSLYGIKQGRENFGACHKAHYINSFFTTNGIESFGDTLGIDYATSAASSECVVSDNDNGDQDQGDQNHNEQLYSNSQSYSTGCSSDGQFIMATFQGAYCDGLHYIETTDTMSDLNSNLDNLGCLSVYSSSDGTDTISELLSYSASCSVMEYPTRCPDPHGTKAKRDMKLYNKSLWQQQQKTHLVMPILSSVFMVLSFFLFWRSAVVRNRIGDPMDDARDARDIVPTRLEKVARSFGRSLSRLSEKTCSFKERLQEYAEEQDYAEEQESDQDSDILATVETEEEKEAPVLVASAPKPHDFQEDPVLISNAEVANAILAEKGVSPRVATQQKKTSSKRGVSPRAATQQKKTSFKRPRLAKISRFLFGKKKNQGGRYHI